ncbi:DUF4232 domain-containing protein [Streptomyces sp. NBC_01537]|uniref:DUF4232 domain-containing protein n=1 Tax=Streptomyces sp. NBC_01537 TaxID=2903896 RepID=UPI003869CD15
MRSRTLPATVLGLTAAAALTLTACGGDGGGSDNVAGSASPSASASASTAASASASSATTPTASTPTTTADNAASTTASSSRCRASDVTIAFATGDDAKPGTTGQTKTYVEITNKTKKTCTLKGFPGLDLKGGSVDWPLARTGQTPQKVDAEPGVSVEFTITYLPWTKGSGTRFQPTTAVVILPDDTTPTTLTWPWGPVLLQDGATHPGTYVGPIGS